MGRSAAAEAQVCSPLLRRTPSSADCILPEYIFVSWLPGSPPLLDLFCDPARAFPAPMTALKSRACLLWWVWGPVNAWRFNLSCATEVSGRVLKDGVYFENLSLQPVVHHILKTMPFCYHSLLLLLLCLLTFSVWDFLGAFHHKRSKCHKYQNSREGAREIPRALLISLPQFWQRNWKGKLLHFTSFCPLPFLLKMYWGRNTHTKKKYKDICLFCPQKCKHF